MSDWATIPQMVFAQAQKYRQKPALRVKRAGAYKEITWYELASQVESAALGLIDLGVQPGDRVAILSESRPEWAIADLGILSAGAVTVPIYTTLSSEEIEFILKDAGVKILFASSTEMMAKVLPFQESLGFKCVLFEAPYRITGPRVWWFGELLGLGHTTGPQMREALPEFLKNAKADDLASIIYTSGTTGVPKGVMLTHNNFLSNCRAIAQALPIGDTDSTLSFLPLSHVFERTAGYYFVLFAGGTITYAESIDKVGEQLPEVKPTILTAVPRFYEKLYERVQAAIQSASKGKQAIFHWASRVGKRWAARRLRGQPIPPLLALQYRLAKTLVFEKLHARMGGRLRFCISGSAPLSKDLGEFFYAAGILILEGYGLTETSPVVSCNRPDRLRFGTVGLVVEGVQVRIADDGEILIKGPNVTRGYYNNPQATAEAIDPDGWFHSGDIGTLDEEGFLSITDRKKDLIKTSGGKMVAPQKLEAALKKERLIQDCVIIGDRHKYITALIVPNLAKVEAYAKKHGLRYDSTAELLELPEIVSLLWESVHRVNAPLAPFEQIKKITLLPEPFSLAGGELTPTLKVKRRVIAQRYAEKINKMYEAS
ncbi:MAG: long-chain fatty acid--CoA ligase [Candidatus Omnitrophica bacterium]|nr:long-chain fatty acid--CoA ligase [Candidatus Omnitrophota bacterium]